MRNYLLERFRDEKLIIIKNWIQMINTHFILNFLCLTHQNIAVNEVHLFVGFCLHVLSLTKIFSSKWYRPTLCMMARKDS